MILNERTNALLTKTRRGKISRATSNLDKNKGKAIHHVSYCPELVELTSARHPDVALFRVTIQI